MSLPHFTDQAGLIDFSKLTGQQLVATQPVTTFEEAWAQIQNRNIAASQILEGSAGTVQQLIEQARERLAAGGTKKVDGTELPTVEAGDPATVKQIHALAAEAKQAVKEAQAQVDLYTQVLKDMLGDPETAAERLTVNGAEIATWKRSKTTILNQQAVKNAFPQGVYPELYTEQERRTFLLK